jgi:hypothetical protein
VAGVTALLTLVDIDDSDDDGPDARRMSVRARHEAVLEDGRRVVLLDDRGWTGAISAAWTDDDAALPSIWAVETVEELERTARVVVGPDEPGPGGTQAEMEAGHWETLAGILRAQGVDVDAAELPELPHDVELSTRLRERVARAAS